MKKQVSFWKAAMIKDSLTDLVSQNICKVSDGSFMANSEFFGISSEGPTAKSTPKGKTPIKEKVEELEKVEQVLETGIRTRGATKRDRKPAVDVKIEQK